MDVLLHEQYIHFSLFRAPVHAISLTQVNYCIHYPIDPGTEMNEGLQDEVWLCGKEIEKSYVKCL